MNKPLVSVIMPVYNAGKYLYPSLQSILSQTYRNIEILIVDDGSTDGCIDTIADIKDSRIRIITQRNFGRSSAMNRGLDELSGDFYIAQDADDISHPYRIERQIQCLLKDIDLAAVFAGHDLIINERHMAPRFASKNVQDCRADIEGFRMPGIGATAMYRVAMVSSIRFETALKVAEDLDYILRIGEHYPMTVLGDCLYSYRIHGRAATKQDPILNREMEYTVYVRACRRRGIEIVGSNPSMLCSYVKQEHRIKTIGVVPHFIESVLDLRQSGQYKRALKTALDCGRMYPYDFLFWKPLAYFIVPIVLIRLYRNHKVK